jgi:hypothetical protein
LSSEPCPRCVSCSLPILGGLAWRFDQPLRGLSPSGVAPVEPFPHFLCLSGTLPVNLGLSSASLNECRSCPTNTYAAAAASRKRSLSF